MLYPSPLLSLVDHFTVCAQLIGGFIYANIIASLTAIVTEMEVRVLALVHTLIADGGTWVCLSTISV